jgi:DNA-binding beta-propeller fold protein YncE
MRTRSADFLISGAALAAFFSAALMGLAQKTPNRSLLALSKRNHTLAIVDRLKFSPDGKLVLISMLGSGDLVIYDAASRKEFKRVPIGHGAAGILIDSLANRAFIACGPDNYVAVLDLKTLEVTGHIDVGGEPDGLAWAVQP